ncbi:MAG: 50S ribosomal protein L21 [Anaerolineae bacterium]|nr:50S ribosomal protein L21 [Anaerolineae bacterium]MCX8066711.1 50S ribosomal protein L21 [Anaerolineae bacterium]MDW7992991.1 50S ribosomal protein L21 [Anaerolineae bacterium]
MYAVVRTGGHQYRVSVGDQLLVEKLPVPEGAHIELEEVLLVADDSGQVRIGTPLVEGARVRARVLAQEKGPKIRIFKYIPKERYRRRKGHRQQYTRLQVEEIVV